MKEYDDRKEFEKIFETVRNNIKERIIAKGLSMKGSAKGTALSEIIAVFDEELELGIAEELMEGRRSIRNYYRKYCEVESLERKLRENEQKLEAQQKLSGTISFLTDETLKNAIVAYEALSDRRGRSDAKEIVIAYIKSKGREDLTGIIDQTEREGEWIPCSDRLPEDIRPVLVTWKNTDPSPYYQSITGKHFIGAAHYHRGKWYWYSSVTEDLLAEYGECESEEFDEAIKVVAWMPLPEPWKGADDETD